MGHRLGYPGHAPYQAATCAETSEYLDNLCVDTPGFRPSMLKQLVEVFGPARVLFGTDCPAVPIGPAEHVGLVESLEAVRGSDRRHFEPERDGPVQDRAPMSVDLAAR